MGTFDKLKFAFGDEVQTVCSLIKKWKPEKLKAEKKYEKSLIAYLRKDLAGLKITPQYAVGRAKADLVIGGKVIVEIKTDLKTTGQFQRLKGQLTDYATWDGRIIVLLTGETDPDILSSLKSFIKEENGRLKHFNPLEFVGNEKVTVLEK